MHKGSHWKNKGDITSIKVHFDVVDDMACALVCRHEARRGMRTH